MFDPQPKDSLCDGPGVGLAVFGDVLFDGDFCDGGVWAPGGFRSYVWACNGQQTAAKTTKDRYPIFRHAVLRINESPRNSSQLERWLKG
jgi:hypothetical protein